MSGCGSDDELEIAILGFPILRCSYRQVYSDPNKAFVGIVIEKNLIVDLIADLIAEVRLKNYWIGSHNPR